MSSDLVDANQEIAKAGASCITEASDGMSPYQNNSSVHLLLTWESVLQKVLVL